MGEVMALALVQSCLPEEASRADKVLRAAVKTTPLTIATEVGAAAAVQPDSSAVPFSFHAVTPLRIQRVPAASCQVARGPAVPGADDDATLERVAASRM